MSLLRTRWAALGAAVAITLAAGGIGTASVGSGERTVFVPITPCRVIDTRPAFPVGPRSSPLGPNETYTVSAHGTNGKCTIPNDAVALSLNVTAVGATLPTFLTIWAAGQARPDASSLNPAPGQPPTPNAVTTDLSGAGQFHVYNLQGQVHVLADVNGYYADHHHDDRYHTKAQVENLVFDGAIPSGVTVTGNIYWDSHGSTNKSSDAVSVAFPSRAPVPLTDARVNFDQVGVTGDGDPQCTGSDSAPTAPAGKVCIYLAAHNGMATNTLFGYAGFPLADAGFFLQWAPDGTDNVDEYVAASWAYTAP